MTFEAHFSQVMTGASIEVSGLTLGRVGLVFQNNGANDAYIAFGRPAWGDGNDFVVKPGAVWVLDALCPKESVNLKGTAGDLVSILEFFA